MFGVAAIGLDVALKTSIEGTVQEARFLGIGKVKECSCFDGSAVCQNKITVFWIQVGDSWTTSEECN